MTGRRILFPVLVFLCLVAVDAAFAEAPPPSRVGRVSLTEGNLAIRQGTGEWTDSAVNDPVMAGMSVRTGQGRAMLRIGAETVALDAGSEIELAELDGSGTQIVLRHGRIGVRLSQLDPARSIEIDLPRGGAWLLTPGDYDITAGDEHSPARVAVPDGRARFVGGGLDTAIATGSAAVLSADTPPKATSDAATTDDFIAWWRPPGRQDPDSEALQHVPADMTGYEALDGHGKWETVAGAGAVWFPNALPVGWAPFRDGHWRWIAPWGWTWVDDLAWGFAPSHYGRWARFPTADAASASDDNERWGWVPGALPPHPAYAPAVVAFLGTAGVGISMPDAFGPAVAWFPLAPGEIYWPGWTSDADTLRRLNPGPAGEALALTPMPTGEPPAAVVNGEYRNRRFASIVPRAAFLAGKPVAAALVTLPGRRLDNAPLLAGSPQIMPASAHAPALAGALQTLARILAPRVAPAAAGHPVVLRGAHGHARFAVAVARPRIVAAVAHGRTRLRLAAIHRTRR